MTTIFKSRSAWTDEPRGGAQLTGIQLFGNAIHWPGTSTDAFGVESESRIAARLRGWWDFHVNTRGWSDIGYNFAIDQGGRVWDLRGLARVGAHCASRTNPDANHEWMGVLLILGDQEPPSAAMIRAFQDYRYLVFLPRWPGRLLLTGHGREPGVPGAQTDCCGPFAAARIRDGSFASQPGMGDNKMTPEQEAKLDDFIGVEADRYVVYTNRYKDLVRRHEELAALVAAIPGADPNNAAIANAVANELHDRLQPE